MSLHYLGASTRRHHPVQSFTPGNLFAAGEQGAWFDYSDLSTLFQDSAGTTPVTAVEQPVGLALDKSKGGISGTNLANAIANFPTSAGWILDASVTIAANTMTFASTASTFGATFSLGAGFVNGQSYLVTITSPTLTAGQFRSRLDGGSLVLFTATTGTLTAVIPAGASGIGQVQILATGVTSGTITSIKIQAIPGNHATQATAGNRPTYRARYNQLLATATLSTQSITTLAATYRISFSGAGTVTLSGTGSGVFSAGTNTFVATAGTLTCTVAGAVNNADIRLNSTSASMPAYQNVVNGTTYDTAGFLPYLAFNGTSSAMATPSIPFTAAQMSVFAGVTKLSDAAQAVVAETSASIAANNGTFLLSAPNSAAANFNFSAKGTSEVDNTVTTFAAPYTAVLTGLSDLGAPTTSIQVNNGAPTSLATATGGGVYAANVLNIGARAGTSLFAPMNLYGLIVRGAASTAAEVSNTVGWLDARTGAY